MADALIEGPYRIVKRGSHWGIDGPSEPGWVWQHADGAQEHAQQWNVVYAAGHANALAALQAAGMAVVPVEASDGEIEGAARSLCYGSIHFGGCKCANADACISWRDYTDEARDALTGARAMLSATGGEKKG